MTQTVENHECSEPEVNNNKNTIETSNKIFIDSLNKSTITQENGGYGFVWCKDNNLLRGRTSKHPERIFCPLTAACLVYCGKIYGNNYADYAASEMNVENTKKIVDIADGFSNVDNNLQEEIYTACKLSV